MVSLILRYKNKKSFAIRTTLCHKSFIINFYTHIWKNYTSPATLMPLFPCAIPSPATDEDGTTALCHTQAKAEFV